jgi:NADH dehydrogenase FAD-containing subunit
MLEFLPRIAVGFDLELSNLLQRLLTAQGITFHLETKVSAVKEAALNVEKRALHIMNR